jgi:ribonuclease Z
MPTLHLLGTGAAVTDAHRTTTMLACTDGTSTVVVDCGGDVVQRLLAAGIDLDTLTTLYLTHEHPDHVSGFPLFVEKIWLHGRMRPLDLYGIAPALDQARRCFATFNTAHWDLPELRWHEVPYEENALVLDDLAWRITAAPGLHAVPCVGLRIESKASGGVVAYSCDTEPSEVIVRLSHRADVLVHEANGALRWHTSPQDAARIAVQAEARRLLLIHLPPNLPAADLEAARQVFPATDLAEELAQFMF